MTTAVCAHAQEGTDPPDTPQEIASQDESLNLLRQSRYVELDAKMNGIQRSWGATIVIDQGAPLRDPDPDQLASYYRVDAGKPYWRGGAWSASP